MDARNMLRFARKVAKSTRTHSSVTVIRNSSVWTKENIVKSPLDPVVLPNLNVTDYIWKNLDKWADKTALVCAITKQSYSYHELYKYSHNFAANLRKKLQINNGDIVCIMAANSPNFSVALLGGLQAGATVTTINPVYTPYEINKQLQLSQPKVIIGTSKTTQVLKEALELAKKHIPLIVIQDYREALQSGTISFKELALDDNVDHSILKEVSKQSKDVALLPYSSGTTGMPKGVELTHRNLVSNFVQIDIPEFKLYNDTEGSNQDTTLGILPFFHVFGLSVVLLHKLSVGLRIATLPSFQPETFLAALKDLKVNILYVPPPIILFLGSHPDAKREHLESLNNVVSGAAPLAKRDVFNVIEKAKPEFNFMQAYGLTETSPIATHLVKGVDKYHTSGIPVANTELKVLDPDLRSLGPNEVGELLIRGPQVMKGYKNNPEANKNAIDEENWFHTGDMVTIDENGYVTVVDRLKELIKVKGFQVPPAELESVLKEHPDVHDAAVIGVPDDKTGEAPKAFVVFKNGQKTSEKDIMNFVSGKVAKYKWLKDVVVLDAIPKNPSGKILRRVLKEKYA